MVEGAQEVWVTVDGERFLVKVEDLDQRPVVAYVDGRRFEVEIQDDVEGGEELEKKRQEAPVSGSIPAGASSQVAAPMPGDIIQIHVKAGQAVKAGDPLCVLDAMKMKNTIHAPRDGEIAEICINEGQSVEFGVPLFRLG